MGRVTHQDAPEGRTVDYTYNDMGLVHTTTLPTVNGHTTITTTTYTATGQVETFEDPLGRTTTYDYDRLDRLTTVTQPDPDDLVGGNGPLVQPVTRFTYDNLDRLLTQTDPGPAPSAYVTSYQYENYGRKVTVTQPDPDTSGSGLPPPKMAYEYNAAGQLVKVSDLTDLLHSSTTEYWFDELGRPKQAQVTPPSSALLGPTFDKVGNVISDTDLLGNITEYECDARNRLIKTTLPYPSNHLINGFSSEPGEFSVGGEWSSSQSPAAEQPYYQYATRGEGDPDSATWTFSDLVPDKTYEVFVTWVADEQNNTSAAPFTFDQGTASVPVDQRYAPESDPNSFFKRFALDGPYYRRLNTFVATQETLTVSLSDSSVALDKRIVADGVRLVEARPVYEYTYSDTGQLLTVSPRYSPPGLSGALGSSRFLGSGPRGSVMGAGGIDPDWTDSERIPAKRSMYP